MDFCSSCDTEIGMTGRAKWVLLADGYKNTLSAPWNPIAICIIQT